MQYRIESTAGVDLGIFEGATVADAIEAMARDAGYASAAEMDEVTGGDHSKLIVTEVSE